MPADRQAVKLHPGAEADLKESVDFYRAAAGEKLVSRFKQCVADGVETIAANPNRGAMLPDMIGVRRLRIKVFPFSLIFIERADAVWVVAVAHRSRKPGYWKHRLS
jgi:plasmid stabilization system protein ParE